ncbi:MAG: hypothetical protein Kow0059_05160 [Candidatus Sumerlaeia bacterium]
MVMHPVEKIIWAIAPASRLTLRTVLHIAASIAGVPDGGTTAGMMSGATARAGGDAALLPAGNYGQPAGQWQQLSEVPPVGTDELQTIGRTGAQGNPPAAPEGGSGDTGFPLSGCREFALADWSPGR